MAAKNRNGDPVRVLIADDQACAREGLGALLRTCRDFVVVGVAEDGRAAVDLAAARDAEIVLMDVRMPVLDGLEATRILKQGNPAVSVLVLTLHAHAAAAAKDAGADAFLEKTAAAPKLIQALRNLAKRHRPPREAHA